MKINEKRPHTLPKSPFIGFGEVRVHNIRAPDAQGPFIGSDIGAKMIIIMQYPSPRARL